MHHCLCRAVLPFRGFQSHRGLAGQPQTWCCGEFATSTSQKEKSVTQDQEPKLSNLPLPLLCLSSFLQWNNILHPLWRAPCLLALSRPTLPLVTHLPAETTLRWSTSCILPSPSTAPGRSTASPSEQSESTWETVMFTACITWSGMWKMEVLLRRLDLVLVTSSLT